MHIHQIIDRLLSIQFNSIEKSTHFNSSRGKRKREAVTSVISREGQLWSSGQQTSEYFALSSEQWILVDSGYIEIQLCRYFLFEFT